MPNSAWTETGSSISLVPVTTPIDPGSSPNNVNYLTNANKIALMQQYAAELAMKTSLDSLASTWSVSSTAYDNAVAAISTALINAGAPSNWATTWPDGTTSGPWTGIQTSLSNLWSQVATQRTALQSSISNAQAAAAQAAAIATAATNAANTYAASIAAPVVVSSLPTLPSSSYPTGKLALLTTTGVLYQSTGSAWTTVTVSGGSLTANTITAGQIAAGAIGATQIAAGAITVDKLTVMDFSNQCLNPGFETGTNAQWESGIISTAYANTGSYSLKLPNGGGTYAVRNRNRIPVVAGQVYLMQCWVYITAALSSGGVYVRIRGLNASGAEVWTASDAMVSSPVGAWTRISTTQTVPAEVVAANIEVVSASPVGGDIYVDDFYYRRCDDSSLIVDGSITASKIAAGAINASMITTGTLNAANVAVTNLNASNITTGTLAATQVLFSDGTTVDTANRVVTSTKSQQNTSTTSGVSTPGTILTNLSFTLTANSANDVFNFFGLLYGAQTVGTVGTTCNVNLCVDSTTVIKTSSFACYPVLNVSCTNFFMVSVTGLAAGSHTFQFYLSSSLSSATFQSYNGTTVLAQHVY